MKIVFPVDNDRTLNLIFKIFSDKGFECGINRTCLDNWLSAQHQYAYSPHYSLDISWGSDKENLFNNQELL